MKQTIETDRLYLRPFSKDDFSLLYSIHGNSDIMTYIGGRKTKKEVADQLLKEVENQTYCKIINKFACFLKKNNEFIGRAGFSIIDNGVAEVGFAFLPPHQGNGYGSEVLESLLKWGFDSKKIQEIIALTHIENLACKKVLIKCGMTYRTKQIIRGIECDVYYKR